MLNDIIRTLASCRKVLSGMLKVLQREVLEKRPVVQHFEFGEIFQGERERETHIPKKEKQRERKRTQTKKARYDPHSFTHFECLCA
mmetsp:Transcript_17113/g.19682  ORF Transcript_17113/g.19682 Transcript_17113/m.19682 type:complete len:86 (+) Transcript_17113:674-931(+)